MRIKLAALPVLALLLCAFSCPASNNNLAQNARDAVATSKGYLDSARAQHPECASPGPATAEPSASTNCQIIYRGVGAKDALLDALEAYCASPDFDKNNGPCTANKDVQPKLQAALDNLNRTINDVKAIGGK